MFMNYYYHSYFMSDKHKIILPKK